MSLHLHIDRLVLEGTNLTSRDRARLDSEFCAALTQMLQNRELHPALARGLATPSLPASTFPMPATPDPSLMGQHIAQNLAGSLTSPIQASRKS